MIDQAPRGAFSFKVDQQDHAHGSKAQQVFHKFNHLLIPRISQPSWKYCQRVCRFEFAYLLFFIVKSV